MNKSLEDRVSRLEKANRWLVFACAGLVVLPLLALVGWNATQDEQKVSDLLRTRKFELLDGDGKVRFELDTTDEHVFMRMLSPEGKMLASLNANDRYKGFNFYNLEGHRLVSLYCDEGSSILSLDQPKWHPHFMLSEDGFALFSKDELRAGLGVVTGEAHIIFLDEDGEAIYNIPPDKP